MPTTRLILALLITATLCVSSNSFAQGSRALLPNDMSLELLGRCALYSLSYQRMANEFLGIEGGMSMLGGSGSSVIFLTGGVRFYAVPGDASPCISGGVVVVTASTDSGPFSDNNSASYGYIGPGFEYRSSGGFVFRGSVYMLVRDGFFIWPGAQFGIAF